MNDTFRRITIMINAIKNYIKKHKFIFILFGLILCVRMCFYSLIDKYVISGDTAEYISVAQNEVANGTLNARRVPAYSVILNVLMKIGDLFNTDYLNLTVILQIICSFGAVILLYDLCINLVKSQKLSAIICLLYAISPQVMGWDMIILTESLSLSGTVAFFWLMVKYLKNPKAIYGILTAVLLLFLVFLKPTFLINIVIVTAFWLIRAIMYKKERSTCAKVLIAMCAVFAVILGYSKGIEKEFGVNTLSVTKLQQDTITIMMHNLYEKYELSSTEDILNDVSELMPAGTGLEKAALIISNYSYKDIKSFNSDIIKNNFGPYLVHKIKTMYLISDLEISDNVWYGFTATDSEQIYNSEGYTLYSPNGQTALGKGINIYRSIIPRVRFWMLYAAIFIEIIIVVKLIVNKKDFWIHLGLLGFLSAIVLASIWGTCGEYGRTMICVLPYFYISILLLIESGKFKVFSTDKDDEVIYSRSYNITVISLFIALIASFAAINIYHYDKSNYIYACQLTDDNWTNGIMQQDKKVILFNNTEFNFSKLSDAHKLKCGNKEFVIEEITSDDVWIMVHVDKDADICSYPNKIKAK